MRQERLTPIIATTRFDIFAERIEQERDCLSFFARKSKQPASTAELTQYKMERYQAQIERDRSVRGHNPDEISIEIKS
jgi:hypothetical protein